MHCGIYKLAAFGIRLFGTSGTFLNVFPSTAVERIYVPLRKIHYVVTNLSKLSKILKIIFLNIF